MRYKLYKMDEGDLADCMTPRVVSTCRKPARSYFAGINGPYYRCGKCTRIFLRERPDFDLVEEPTQPEVTE
jgi:hypothetical protein